MMQVFMSRLRSNFQTQPLYTAGVIVGLSIAGFILGVLLDGIVQIGPMILFISIPATFWAASYVRKFGWFFGRDMRPPDPEAEQHNEGAKDVEEDEDIALNSDGTHPAHINDERVTDVVQTALVPRSTPVGTSIVTLRPERAAVRVKSVIHFWCWFAPASLFVLAFLLAPVGGWIGVAVYRNSRPWHQFQPEEAANASLTGASLVFGFFIIAAIWSFFANRPVVDVTVTPETIRYGSTLFDRTHAYGLRVGYRIDGVEIKASLTDDRFGVKRLRLA